jgi:hypothetical protein
MGNFEGTNIGQVCLEMKGRQENKGFGLKISNLDFCFKVYNSIV